MLAVTVRAAVAVEAVAAALVAAQQPPSLTPGSEAATLLDWIIRIVLATSLLVNAYLLRDVWRSIKDCKTAADAQEKRIFALELQYKIWLQYEHDEHGLDRRRGERRRGDDDS